MPPPSNRALYIGIASYPHLLQQLPGCDADALTMAELMSDVYQHPLADASASRILKNADATKANVISQMQWLFQDFAAGSKRLLYFSGYGSHITTGDPPQTTDDALLCYDAVSGQLSKGVGSLRAVDIEPLLPTPLDGTSEVIIVLDTSTYGVNPPPATPIKSFPPAGLDILRLLAGQGYVVPNNPFSQVLGAHPVGLLIASQDDQFAYEVQIGGLNGQISRGSFTDSLKIALTGAGKALPLSALADSLDAQIATEIAAVTAGKQVAKAYGAPGGPIARAFWSLI